MTLGQCKYCKGNLQAGTSLKHFQTCPSRLALFEKLSQKTNNSWFFLRAKQPPYWLDFLLPEEWSLADLDHLLRDTWLECCGHLSLFRIGTTIYERFQDSGWLTMDEELGPSMDVELGTVLDPGKQFVHEYDYGSTTELDLKVLKSFCLPIKKQAFVCARNLPPNWPCFSCQMKASFRCSYCEDYVCKECVPGHECVREESSDHMMSPLVNSPRTGVCGYVGGTAGV